MRQWIQAYSKLAPSINRVMYNFLFSIDLHVTRIDSNKRLFLTSRATLSSINRIKSRITKHFGFETTFRFPSNWKQAYLVFERINFNRLNIQARLGFFSIDRIPISLLQSRVKVNPDEILKAPSIGWNSKFCSITQNWRKFEMSENIYEKNWNISINKYYLKIWFHLMFKL